MEAVLAQYPDGTTEVMGLLADDGIFYHRVDEQATEAKFPYPLMKSLTERGVSEIGIFKNTEPIIIWHTSITMLILGGHFAEENGITYLYYSLDEAGKESLND